MEKAVKKGSVFAAEGEGLLPRLRVNLGALDLFVGSVGRHFDHLHLFAFLAALPRDIGLSAHFRHPDFFHAVLQGLQLRLSGVFGLSRLFHRLIRVVSYLSFDYAVDFFLALADNAIGRG